MVKSENRGGPQYGSARYIQPSRLADNEVWPGTTRWPVYQHLSGAPRCIIYLLSLCPIVRFDPCLSFKTKISSSFFFLFFLYQDSQFLVGIELPEGQTFDSREIITQNDRASSISAQCCASAGKGLCGCVLVYLL